MAGGKRRPHRTPIQRRHVSNSSSTVARRSWNTTGHSYSGGEGDLGSPIHLASSSAVAFVDPNPNTESTLIPTYNYDPAIVGELGIGFHNEAEEEEDGGAVLIGGVRVYEEGTSLESTPVLSYNYDPVAVGGLGLGFHEEEEDEEERGGGGFISIGGVRVYTEDTSSPEEEDEASRSESEDPDDEESDGSSSSSGEKDGSEMDEELAEDYIEMIGGSKELLNSKWLARNNLDGVLNMSSDDEEEDKLGAIDLMNASSVYGMKKKKRSKSNIGKSTSGSPLVEIGLSAAMGDLMFAKDPRSVSARRRGRKEMKVLSQLSRSWPREGQRSREYYGVAGGRKKHRKEVIAIKRRERMINRGVDLDQINSKLRQLVLDDVDMFSFQPMQSRDCSQVQRLAAIYRFRSGCQGSGKKRFVTVTRTSQTCLPSSCDKVRLDKLLGEGIREDPMANCETKIRKVRSKTDRKPSLHQSAPAKLAKSGEASGKKQRNGKQSAVAYSDRPVSFVSCGTVVVDSVVESPTHDPSEYATDEKRARASSSKVGSFEMHTKGFGSKMMAKMGFVQGGGLGKDGQGMAHALEGIQRPKSLGLGMQFDEAAEDTNATNVNKATKDGREEMRGIGAFEKHTKGFGSKMMTRMGFVPGAGLGKDAQGILNPLTAVRRPKARGLGAES